MKKSELLNEILTRKNIELDRLTNEFIKTLKKDCKTFKEIKLILDRFECEIKWQHYDQKNEDILFLQNIKKRLDKEMNDSQLTNHS